MIPRTTPCLAVFYYNTVQSERTQTFTRGGKVEAVSTNSPTNLMKRWCNELAGCVNGKAALEKEHGISGPVTSAKTASDDRATDTRT